MPVSPRGLGRLQKATERYASPSGRNAGWSLTGFAGRAVFSLIVFVAVGRALNTSGYGDFAGIIALATLVAPLNTMGVGEALVQTVSRDRSRFAEAWGEVLLAGATIGVGIYVATVALGVLLFDVAWTSIALLTAMEFISMAVLANHGRACYAADRYAATAVHAIGEGVARAAAAVLFLASGSNDLDVLGLAMLTAVIASSIASTLWLRRHLGRPVLRGHDLLSSARIGAPFALSQSSTALQANVDKAMLLSYGFRSDNGIYAAAFRLIAYATMPMMAVFQASLPLFFREGQRGISYAVAQSRRVRRPALAGAAVATIAAIAGAPIAAWALSGQFGGVVPVVLALSGYPLLKGLQLLYADVLTGSGRQSLRARLQTATAVLNILLNLYLIPRYSWKGAVASTYASEIVFLALVFLAVAAAQRAAGDR